MWNIANISRYVTCKSWRKNFLSLLSTFFITQQWIFSGFDIVMRVSMPDAYRRIVTGCRCWAAELSVEACSRDSWSLNRFNAKHRFPRQTFDFSPRFHFPRAIARETIERMSKRFSALEWPRLLFPQRERAWRDRRRKSRSLALKRRAFADQTRVFSSLVGRYWHGGLDNTGFVHTVPSVYPADLFVRGTQPWPNASSSSSPSRWIHCTLDPDVSLIRTDVKTPMQRSINLFWCFLTFTPWFCTREAASRIRKLSISITGTGTINFFILTTFCHDKTHDKSLTFS